MHGHNILHTDVSAILLWARRESERSSRQDRKAVKPHHEQKSRGEDCSDAWKEAPMEWSKEEIALGTPGLGGIEGKIGSPCKKSNSRSRNQPQPPATYLKTQRERNWKINRK